MKNRHPDYNVKTSNRVRAADPTKAPLRPVDRVLATIALSKRNTQQRRGAKISLAPVPGLPPATDDL